jgi:hypothetical protein
MDLSISEMYHVLFNCLLEWPNADCVPPSFKLDEADGEFHLELLLFIHGTAMDHFPQLVSDQLHISQASGCPSVSALDRQT